MTITGVDDNPAAPGFHLGLDYRQIAIETKTAEGDSLGKSSYDLDTETNNASIPDPDVGNGPDTATAASTFLPSVV